MVILTILHASPQYSGVKELPEETLHQQQIIFGLKTTNFKDGEMYMAGLLGT